MPGIALDNLHVIVNLHEKKFKAYISLSFLTDGESRI